ncbi:MAG: gamma-glutamyl kinase [Pseudomonadota bacterium]
MLVFLEKSLAIYANPKTGSTALEYALDGYADIVLRSKLKHVRVIRAQRRLLPLLKGTRFAIPEGFVIIREPIEWLHSWYRYRLKDDTEPQHSTKEISFDEYVGLYLQDVRPECARVGQQSKFVAGNGPLSIKHMFAHEHTDRAIGFLIDRLGFDFPVGWENESPKKPLEIEPKTEAKLRSFFSDDYDIYDRAITYSLGFEPPQ